MHGLFVLGYMTGSTPASSKKSRTVLLYKKEAPLDIKNYRPIALGLLTDCMTDYAEHYDIRRNNPLKIFRMYLSCPTERSLRSDLVTSMQQHVLNTWQVVPLF